MYTLSFHSVTTISSRAFAVMCSDRKLMNIQPSGPDSSRMQEKSRHCDLPEILDGHPQYAYPVHTVPDPNGRSLKRRCLYFSMGPSPVPASAFRYSSLSSRYRSRKITILQPSSAFRTVWLKMARLAKVKTSSYSSWRIMLFSSSVLPPLQEQDVVRSAVLNLLPLPMQVTRERYLRLLNVVSYPMDTGCTVLTEPAV